MASLTELKNLLAKATSDAKFRALLLKNPAQAAQGMGINLSEAQSAAVKNLHQGIKTQAESLASLAGAVHARIVTQPMVLLKKPEGTPRKSPTKPV